MFSMERAWQDMVAMLRAHREGIVAVAGIFAFLPSLAYNLFVPQPEVTPGAANAAETIVTFFMTWWPAFLAIVLTSMFGGLAILKMALNDRPVVVGESLSSAARLWPSAAGFWGLCVVAAAVATLLGAFVVGIITLALFGRSPIGQIFSVLAFAPAIYLMGRTVHGNALIVSEGERNPLRVFSSSVTMSKGRGWAIAAMFVLVSVVYFVILLAATSLAGILVSLVAPAAAGFIQALISALLAASLSVVTFLLSGAIYKQLSARPRPGAGS